MQGNKSRSPPRVELAEQPKGDADTRDATPKPQRTSPSKQPQQGHQPQGTNQNDPQHLLHPVSQAIPDLVTRVPTDAGGTTRGGPDKPPAPLQADPQQWRVPATTQAIRTVPESSAALQMQQAHQIAQLSGQANIRHSVWDAASGPRLDSGGMQTEALTQVAAAAAVAAAQAVKSDASSELSQVLKAVLLQQTSLSMQQKALETSVSAPTIVHDSSAPYASRHATQHPSTPPHAPASAVPVVWRNLIYACLLYTTSRHNGRLFCSGALSLQPC